MVNILATPPGLVHVSRTPCDFRERRIVELSSGILEVIDPPQLETLGSLRRVEERAIAALRLPQMIGENDDFIGRQEKC